MEAKKLDFSNKVESQSVYDLLFKNYELLGRDWIAHQWKWMNAVYQAFKDHYKYLIIISLVEKTLQFYDQMNIKLTYDQFYSKSYLQIDKFNISELCEKLQLPKETVRRKVLELEKIGVLKRVKKQIIIDRNTFSFIKPENQMKYTSKYILLVSEILSKEKLYSKKLDAKFIENILKKNFSITWRWFYKMQIPTVIGYHEMFEDLTTFHIWGTVCMNQAFNYSKIFEDKNKNKKNSLNYINFHKEVAKNYLDFNTQLIKGKKIATNGVSAMSISDMTNIPRATVIRKCQSLIKRGILRINEKKQYFLTGNNRDQILNYQLEFFKEKSKFLTRILNLIAIS